MRREAGERRANVEEAIALCRATLEIRAPERNAYDWAHTQLSLGAALEQLAALDDNVDVELSFAAYREIIANGDRLDTPWLLGTAHMSLGLLHLEAAEKRNSPQANLDAHQAGTLDELYDVEPHLPAARAELEAARPVIRSAPDPIYYGRALAALSDVLADLDCDDEAIEVGRAALEILRADSAPAACVQAAAALGGVLSRPR